MKNPYLPEQLAGKSTIDDIKERMRDILARTDSPDERGRMLELFGVTTGIVPSYDTVDESRRAVGIYLAEQASPSSHTGTFHRAMLAVERAVAGVELLPNLLSEVMTEFDTAVASVTQLDDHRLAS